ncbi:DUF6286 domain-containing protein [Kineococcus gynurae]|uniref:DUF6286 domain-containing protein n=1 Tax=Kineococcus gynurae TaxID=452979 RepID=A0ABV5LRE7_9ACTN
MSTTVHPGAHAQTTMPPARPATGAGPIGVVGPVLAVLLVGLGVVVGREALVADGYVAGSSWAAPALGAVDGLTPTPLVVAIGVVAALVGLWLVVTALRPRSRTAVPVDERISLSGRDVARLASGAAADVDGVLDVSTTATRRRVVTTVDALSPDVSREVQARVEQRLSAIAAQPQVQVKVRTRSGGAR